MRNCTSRHHRCQTLYFMRLPLRYRITYLGVIVFGALCLIIMRFINPDPRMYGTHETIFPIPCLFYQVFGIKCPSCGITTSVALLLRGEFADSVSAHPFGIVVVLVTVAAIILSVYGLIRGSKMEWLFGRRMRIMMVCIIIIYLAVWVFRIGIDFQNFGLLYNFPTIIIDSCA